MTSTVIKGNLVMTACREIKIHSSGRRVFDKTKGKPRSPAARNSLQRSARSSIPDQRVCTKCASGVHQESCLPGVHQVCTRCAPCVHYLGVHDVITVHQVCTRCAPGVHQVCIGVCTRCAPRVQWYITKLPLFSIQFVPTSCLD